MEHFRDTLYALRARVLRSWKRPEGRPPLHMDCNCGKGPCLSHIVFHTALRKAKNREYWGDLFTRLRSPRRSMLQRSFQWSVSVLACNTSSPWSPSLALMLGEDKLQTLRYRLQSASLNGAWLHCSWRSTLRSASTTGIWLVVPRRSIILYQNRRPGFLCGGTNCLEQSPWKHQTNSNVRLVQTTVKDILVWYILGTVFVRRPWDVIFTVWLYIGDPTHHHRQRRSVRVCVSAPACSAANCIEMTDLYRYPHWNCWTWFDKLPFTSATLSTPNLMSFISLICSDINNKWNTACTSQVMQPFVHREQRFGSWQLYIDCSRNGTSPINFDSLVPLTRCRSLLSSNFTAGAMRFEANLPGK